MLSCYLFNRLTMASDENIVRLSHKQLRNMAKTYENPQSAEATENKPVERQRKVRPERSIYIPGQSRLSGSQKTSTAESQLHVSDSNLQGDEDAKRSRVNEPVQLDQKCLDKPRSGSANLAAGGASCGCKPHCEQSKSNSTSSQPVSNRHRQPTTAVASPVHEMKAVDCQKGRSADINESRQSSLAKSSGRRHSKKTLCADTGQPMQNSNEKGAGMLESSARDQTFDCIKGSQPSERTESVEMYSQRRGKRPDMRIYVPKPRQQLPPNHRDDDNAVDMGATMNDGNSWKDGTLSAVQVTRTGHQYVVTAETDSHSTQKYSTSNSKKVRKATNVTAGKEKFINDCSLMNELQPEMDGHIVGIQGISTVAGKSWTRRPLDENHSVVKRSSNPKEVNVTGKCIQGDKKASKHMNQVVSHGRSDTEVNSDSELMEWDYKADLHINSKGESRVLNWGDIPPPPPSDDGWSDDDSCVGNRSAAPGAEPKGKRKRSGKPRKRRNKSKQQLSVSQELARESDATHHVDSATDDKWVSDSELDDEQSMQYASSVVKKFEGLVISNSAPHSTSNCKYGQASSMGELSQSGSSQLGSTKSYSKGRQQRGRRYKPDDLAAQKGGTQPLKSDQHVKFSESDSNKLQYASVSSMGPSSVVHQVKDSGQVHETTNASSSKIGGLIHLPIGTVVTDSKLVKDPSARARFSVRGHHVRPRPNRGGRSQGNHRLWDPKNSDTIRYTSGQQLASEELVYPSTDHAVYMGQTPDHQGDRGLYLQQSHPQTFCYPEYSSASQYPVDTYAYHYTSSGFDGAGYSREFYSHARCDAEELRSSDSSPHVKAKCLIQEAIAFDVQLSNLVSRRVHNEQGLRHIMNLRMEIQRRLEQALLFDLDLANQKNVEQLLWKSAFYQVIEMLRHQSSESDSSEFYKQQLLSVLDEGISFYESLLRQLQSMFGFSIDTYVEPLGGVTENPVGRRTKLALVSCQRTLICLGDLARYLEQANHTSNYGRARSWYTKAQRIAPKNGRPYNQLAILALYTGRRLDAVYYYMRSLAASNPFLTARESLMQLFEDAAKKAQGFEQKRKAAESEKRRQKAAKALVKRRRNSSGEGQRVEIWIAPDGHSTAEDQADDDDSDELSSLPMVEVSRQFSVDFLRVHGKLFTKIGMENFPEACGCMLREFDTQLKHSPSPINKARLMQLLAINMFSIGNAIPKDNQMDNNWRSIVQENAVQLGLDMFALLAGRCTALLRSVVVSDNKSSSSGGSTVEFYQYRLNEIPPATVAELRAFLPGMKVWSDWMTCHVHLWNPPPIPLEPELCMNIDVWRTLADFFNVINDLDISDVPLRSQPQTDCSEAVILPEDVELAGFVPLLSLSYSPVYINNKVEKDYVCDCIRISKLRLFADYLCGIEPPVMSYNVETRKYFSALTPQQHSARSQRAKETESVEGDADDVVVEGVEESVTSGSPYASATEDAATDDAADQNISTLKARKEELAKKLAEQTRIREKIKAEIDSTHQESRTVQLEIRPVYLVPDTNCFIDHLLGIQRLLASKKFTIIVPLIVINELDGLSRGSRDRQYELAEHAEMVRSGAEAALNYMEQQFELRNSHVRALTSEGTVLDTIAFRSEQLKDMGKNDDLILSCCLHYCQDKARDFMPKSRDEPIRLQRDVVLLTNDRNLRLKAHLHNVPTKTIVAFLSWANIV